MKLRDAVEWVIAAAIMIPITVAFFIILFGGWIAALFGFGAPPG